MAEHKCLHCGQAYQTTIGDYHYLESGLDNFWICRIEIYRCECGESAAIPQIIELHRTIAKCLLTQKSPLSGKEIRFLRKHMAMKAIDFAKHLGVDNATVSRWENEKGPHSPVVDRFIRLSCAVRMGYFNEAKQLSDDIFSQISPEITATPFYIAADQTGKLTCAQECR
jgi:DNA-binding transcriptional regulator YiaG